ncbi:MAG: thioredoxin [Candidatus Magasanikbacteria bacterium CG_4_9_14_0_2_um_filter_41_10]|uniref:Thioredoxin n=1 Tax=Candidatus Magasanikbacteria bacterium CG_4_10_14_0_2_um_filter_41_31 TaxID=1974639 RepID=A0A2M7V2D4_9BACT|nr:MAG: thioredoxin [Candidatus Magasanikbacteria bacterium CG1_02_41_34]PIZ92578.1 MAG: thioredoxin [Candidatus Magasanikbacteria bacterium CG_4_10_14_0_2_um_filter_41_31]PJC53475.1 MAG: thioredoxin [Candidatus Magasanikbacteria bacterium CG_4_9_14_0_2_um_filter_41_10]
MAQHTFTDDTFDADVLKSDIPVFVDFWAPWCGPCQQMGPIVEELAGEFGDDKVKVGKLNVDENQMIAGQYRVMSIPTFLVFKGGELVDTVVGGVPKDRLKAVIEKHLS